MVPAGRLGDVPVRHVLLAVAVAVVWGVNFTVIELGLDDFPPLLFAGLRYGAVFLAALVIPRPKDVPLRLLVLVGLTLSAGHMGFLFIAMDQGMPAGLASLVLQLQAFFTMGIAVALLHEKVTGRQVAGAIVAFAGIAVIALGRRSGVPLGALLLVIAAAASWGAGNVATRYAAPSSPGALMVWSACVPAFVLCGLSAVVDGPAAMGDALTGIDAGGAAALAYLVIASTAFGFGAWTWLLHEHPASRVAPFTLLVPVVGIATAAVVLGERPNGPEVAGALVVIAGLALPYVRRSRAEVVHTERALCKLPA